MASPDIEALMARLGNPRPRAAAVSAGAQRTAPRPAASSPSWVAPQTRPARPAAATAERDERGRTVTYRTPQLGPEWDGAMAEATEAARRRLTGSVGASQRVDEASARQVAEEVVARVPAVAGLASELRDEAVSEVVADLWQLGPLEPMLADPDVTEVMVNAPREVWVERHGVLELTNAHFRDDAHVMVIAQRIAAADMTTVDMRFPMCDCTLQRPGLPAHRSRVNLTVPPIAQHVLIDIRKFREDIVTPEALVANGTMDQRVSDILSALVRGRMNVLVEGGTGSGKTTLLNAMSCYIPYGQRIIVAEDTQELRLAEDRHVVYEKTMRANAEGAGERTMRDVVINTLRQRPDRVIVGECRGAEVYEMIQAMSTGHDGSLTTVHANSTRHSMSRLSMMFKMADAAEGLTSDDVMEVITEAVDIVVHVRRWADGTRRITEIAEVVGQSNGVPTMARLIRYDEATDTWQPQGERLSDSHRERLETEGVEIDDGWWRR